MKLNLNFASRRYINRRAVTKGYWMVATGLLCLFLWILYQNLFVSTQIQQTRNQLSALQQDEQELLGTKSVSLDSQKIEELRKEFARNQMLLDQDSFHWTALFDRMEKLLPDGISIRAFKPDYEKRTLAIEGYARDLKVLQALLDRLLEADTISNVYLNRHAFANMKDSQGRQHSVLDFSLSLEGVF